MFLSFLFLIFKSMFSLRHTRQGNPMSIFYSLCIYLIFITSYCLITRRSCIILSPSQKYRVIIYVLIYRTVKLLILVMSIFYFSSSFYFLTFNVINYFYSSLFFHIIFLYVFIIFNFILFFVNN